MEFYCMQNNILPKIHFVDDTIIEPPYVHKRRKANEYIMYVIKQGEMYLTEDDVAIELRTGDICILDKARTHVGTRASVCDYFYIHFTHDAFGITILDEAEAVDFLQQKRLDSLKSDIFAYDKCERDEIYIPKVWHVEDIGLWIRLEELLKRAKQENYNPMEHYKILCACYIQQVMIEISRGFLNARSYSQTVPKYYQLVQSVLEWLNQEYASEISSQILEKQFNSNFDYMNRVFKKTMGQTIFQYLTGVRINHAKILILHTPMKMSEVGKKVGFPDEYYFNRVFKKSVGLPPAAYAKIYQT